MKKTIVLVAAVSLCLHVSAQNAADFLNIGTDAANAGVANTGVARQADAYAIENNLATAALSASKMDVAAGYSIWNPQNAKTGIISASGFFHAGERVAVGVGFKNFSEPSYTITTQDGRVGDSFSPKEMAVSAGASFRVAKGLSVGADVKYLSSKLSPEAAASTVGADVSLAYFGKGISAGLAFCNIGGKLNYGKSAYPMPMMAKAGAAYEIKGFTASLEADYVFNEGFMAGIGAEYWIVNIVAVRAGYHYGNKPIPSYASVGLGAKFFGVQLNATYLLASKTLGNTMLFGLGYSF